MTGLPLAEVVQAFSDGNWHCVHEILGRVEVPSHQAVKRFFQWYKRTDLPLDTQIAMGARAIVMGRLISVKRQGYLEADGMPGEKRSFRITPKGRELLNGNGNSQG